MPPLPKIITIALLHSLQTYSNLPPHTWYFITVTTLAVLNRPDEIPLVYEFVLNHQLESADGSTRAEKQLWLTRRLREALIKAAPVAGVPKMINAMLALKEVTPLDFLDLDTGSSPTFRRRDMYQVGSGEVLSRGEAYFEKVYGKVAKRVMDQMDHSGTEDLGLIARLMYGYVLSNTSVLSAAESSFVMIAALIPQDVNPQLKGHLRGALNGGATVAEVRAVRAIIIKICEAHGMRQLDIDSPTGWGWRESVTNL